MHCNFEIYSVSILLEAVVWRCSAEKVFLEILQNSQENACVRVPKGHHKEGLQLYQKRDSGTDVFL